jgi:hypothetical protein
MTGTLSSEKTTTLISLFGGGVSAEKIPSTRQFASLVLTHIPYTEIKMLLLLQCTDLFSNQ